MSDQEIRSIILRIIAAGGPLKYTTLALSTMDYIGPAKFNAGQFQIIIDNLVIMGEIVEIKYKYNNEIRSMYAQRLTELV